VSNLVFPTLDGLKPTRTRAAVWKTAIKESASGKELRAAWMTSPRWRHSLSYEVLRETAEYTDLQQLIGLFNACRGSWDNFLYRDPEHDTVVDQPFGVGDGLTTQFQLVRAYGGFVEPVSALNGPAAIKKNGSVLAQPAACSISAEAVVSFAMAPAIGEALTWSGRYYWRCRFLRDELEIDRFLDDLFEARRVEFITCKGESA